MNKVEFSRTAKVPFEKRYGNFIGGKWVEPSSGKYFEDHYLDSTINGPDGPEMRLPLFPRKRTQVGHRAMSGSCRYWK
jgi:hypothetical protein